MKKLCKFAAIFTALAFAFCFAACSPHGVGPDDTTASTGSGETGTGGGAGTGTGGAGGTTTYTVTFNTNGGSAVASQTVESGKKATKPANPTKESDGTKTFSFVDWYITSDFSGTAFSFDTAITKDTTLYAKWTENTPTPTYIGSKAPSAAKAVGDIVFSDGSATPYTADLSLTDAQKAVAVAVIFYAGSGSDVLGAKTLGVGLKNTQGETTKTLAWTPDNTTGYTTEFTDIQCTPNGDNASNATFTGDLDGSDNWAKVCAADSTGTANAATNYPAFNWVNNYATSYSLTGDFATGWYLPTVAELSMLYRAKATVNSALEKADGTKIADAAFWSSSQYSSYDGKAWPVYFVNGYLYVESKSNTNSVCGVRAF